MPDVPGPLSCPGVFDAAEDRKKFAIGVDANQDWMKPGLILTSMLKRVDVAVFSAIEDAKAGKFTSGVKRFGLSNKGVDYSVDQYNEKLLPESVRRQVDELKAEIIEGKIHVPDYCKEMSGSESRASSPSPPREERVGETCFRIPQLFQRFFGRLDCLAIQKSPIVEAQY